MLSTENRNEVIKRLAARPGANLTKIAKMFGVSRTWVQNLLGNNRKGRTGRKRTDPRPETRRLDDDAIYAWIVEYKRSNDGCSPSYSEIGTGNNCTASGVQFAVKRLAKAGRVTINNGRIHINGGRWTLEEVP